ncbi:MAG: helix-turn-helix transcriptional regulator [Myxococcota bacterium]
MVKKAPVKRASANVFADLGVAEPDIALAKARLAATISEVVSKRSLTQAEAAEILGVDQPKVSALLRGQLAGFSTDRLIRFLTAIGQDVEIVVLRARSRSRRHGHVSVSVA